MYTHVMLLAVVLYILLTVFDQMSESHHRIGYHFVVALLQDCKCGIAELVSDPRSAILTFVEEDFRYLMKSAEICSVEIGLGGSHLTVKTSSDVASHSSRS